MGLLAICECGKRTGVAAVMAGRSIRCSACGNDVFVQPSAPSTAGQSTGRLATREASAVAVSPTLIRFGILGGVLAIVFAIFYFGPWRVGSNWAAMSTRANDETTDVIIYALQAYETQSGYSSARMIHMTPQLQGPASFIPPMMAFTMPRNMTFLGKTNRGNYRGTYDTTTGEIDAVIEYDGLTVAGLVDARKARGEFHITGREKNGHPTAELGGQPLQIGGPRIDAP